jgi:hypothetical protein
MVLQMDVTSIPGLEENDETEGGKSSGGRINATNEARDMARTHIKASCLTPDSCRQPSLPW